MRAAKKGTKSKAIKKPVFRKQLATKAARKSAPCTGGVLLAGDDKASENESLGTTIPIKKAKKETKEDPGIKHNPIKKMTVFLCKGCRTVVSDSNYALATCNMVKMTMFTAYRDVINFGTNYENQVEKPAILQKIECEWATAVSCAVCKAQLGFKFGDVTSPDEEFSETLGVFTDKLESYCLGELCPDSDMHERKRFGPQVARAPSLDSEDNGYWDSDKYDEYGDRRYSDEEDEEEENYAEWKRCKSGFLAGSMYF